MTSAAPPTLRFVVVRGVEYVEVLALIGALRLFGQETAAKMLEESLSGEAVQTWSVRP